MLEEKLKFDTLTLFPLNLFCLTDISLSIPIILSRHNWRKDSKFREQSLYVKSNPIALQIVLELFNNFAVYVRELSPKNSSISSSSPNSLLNRGDGFRLN